MAQITISVPDGIDKPFSFIAKDIRSWVEDALSERANSAVEEIVRICVTKCLETNTAVPPTKNEIVDLAFSRGWVKTIAQQEAEGLAALAALQGQDETNTNV